jgi:hypothetical protein
MKNGVYSWDEKGAGGSKEGLEIPLHKWPSCLLDLLHPIKNVWRILKQHIEQRSRFPSTLSEMKQVVQV